MSSGVESVGRQIRLAKPGQKIGHKYINAIVNKVNANSVSLGYDQGADQHQLRPQIHWLQGSGSFPSVGKTFGPDLFLDRRYMIGSYYGKSTTGTWSVVLTIDGVETGDVITSATNGVKTPFETPVRYVDNALIDLKVKSVSGTVSGFVLVMEAYRIR